MDAGEVKKEKKRAWNAAYYQAHKEKMDAHSRASSLKYRESHRKEIAARQRVYRENNLEASRSRTLKWAREHRDHLNSYSRKIYRERPEVRAKVVQYSLRFVKNNPEKVRSIKSAWKKRNPLNGRESAMRRHALIKTTQTEKVDYRQIIKTFGMVCHICGTVVTKENLHFDHVIPLSKGGPHTFQNIRPSHATCNLEKRAKIVPELVAKTGQLLQNFLH